LSNFRDPRRAINESPARRAALSQMASFRPFGSTIRDYDCARCSLLAVTSRIPYRLYWELPRARSAQQAPHTRTIGAPRIFSRNVGNHLRGGTCTRGGPVPSTPLPSLLRAQKTSTLWPTHTAQHRPTITYYLVYGSFWRRPRKDWRTARGGRGQGTRQQPKRRGEDGNGRRHIEMNEGDDKGVSCSRSANPTSGAAWTAVFHGLTPA